MRKPKRPCAFPGCSHLTEGRFCLEHNFKVKEQTASRNRHYDSFIRDASLASFYKSKEWLRARQAALNRDMYLCQYCLAESRVTPADTVHHIVAIKEDWGKRLMLGNLISLCRKCHNQVHGMMN